MSRACKGYGRLQFDYSSESLNSGGVSAIYIVALPFLHLHHLTFMGSSRSVVPTQSVEKLHPG